MEQRNNKQDRIIFEVEELLNKMSNQVNFLIRKEITMNQLDLDLLMENTRKLYDRLCSVELGVGDENLGIEDEDESEQFLHSDFSFFRFWPYPAGSCYGKLKRLRWTKNPPQPFFCVYHRDAVTGSSGAKATSSSSPDLRIQRKSSPSQSFLQ